MKKIILLIVVILFAFILTACDPETYYFNKNEFVEEVEKIELVKYHNDNYKIVDTDTNVLTFDSTKVEKIETLNETKVDEFLEEFEKIVFHIRHKSVNEPTGYCLLWHLKNGNFIVFSVTLIEGMGYSMVAEFDSNDNFVKHHASFAAAPHFENVLAKYFKCVI